MVFRELQSLHRTLPDRTMAFERQRLVNLIDSKIKRREIETAIGFAEELFRKEVRYALISRTRLLIKYAATLRRIIAVLLGVFSIFTVLTVLNISPFFSLVAAAAAITGIVSAVVADGFLAKRVVRTVTVLLDVYETGRDRFVKKILTDGVEHIDFDDWLRA